MKKFLCVLTIILAVCAIIGAAYALYERKNVIFLNK